MGFFWKKCQTLTHACPDNNYYYFCKSSISLNNPMIGSRNMNKGCEKLDKQQQSLLPNIDNFLVFFIAFEWGIIFESLVDI